MKAKAEIRMGTQIRVRARIRGREWNIVEEKSDPAKLSLSSLLTNDHKLFKVKTCRSSCSLANVKENILKVIKSSFSTLMCHLIVLEVLNNFSLSLDDSLKEMRRANANEETSSPQSLNLSKKSYTDKFPN